jgi:hypothetical protein
MELGNMVFGNSRGAYPVPRMDEFEEQIFRLLEAMGASLYGVNYENDVFWVMPYYWGDCECEGHHDEDCPVVRDNFHYKPTGLGIQWYKYPLRDSYSSRKFSLDELIEIIDACIESVK